MSDPMITIKKADGTFAKKNNYAFIDSQNLNLAIKNQGWILDFGRFRRYLADKYQVRKAFIFIGYMAGNQSLYSYLQENGYHLIFKPTLVLPNGNVKGNVDAELVLHTMIEYNNYEKAIIVSGDGDFYCLVEYLIKQNKLMKLLVPDMYHYSSLLRKFCNRDIAFLSNLSGKLNKLKNPVRTEP